MEYIVNIEYFITRFIDFIRTIDGTHLFLKKLIRYLVSYVEILKIKTIDVILDESHTPFGKLAYANKFTLLHELSYILDEDLFKEVSLFLHT